MTTKIDHRTPQAFKLEPEPTKTKAKPTKIEFATEDPEQELATIPVPPEQRISKRQRWGLTERWSTKARQTAARQRARAAP